MDIDQLKYPIGKYKRPEIIAPSQLSEWIDEIEILPGRLKKAVVGLSQMQLETPYREGGWTVRQVVHHVPDSHMNAYIRFKWSLTEDKPTIKPYFEDKWAELDDAQNAPVDVSISLLEALHRRWVLLLRSMSPTDFKRTFIHPDHGKEMSLEHIAGMYAWHGQHHLAHIQRLKERMKW